MKDLSLHILDIAENSIYAQSTEIVISIEEAITKNWLIISVSDNGKGMEETFFKQVTSPFITTRTNRKVGLGIPLLFQRTQLCEGKMEIISQQDLGTKIIAKMRYNHIDRVPLGDIALTIVTLISVHPEIAYRYEYCYEDKKFIFDTREIVKILDNISITEIAILKWLKAYIENNMKVLCKS